MPEISIIIPVYNVEKYIARCLDSVLNQSFTDYEILIVDDCGTDASMEIVRQYATRDSRIKILSHLKNLGTMRARETGYMQARGKFLIFIDGDDSLPKHSLSTMLSSMTDDDDITIGNLNYINRDGKVSVSKNTSGRYTTLEKIYSLLLTDKLTHSLCGRIFRAKLLQEHTYITSANATNGEDAFLFYQIVENVRAINIIQTPVYNYIQNPQSSTNTVFSKSKVCSIYETLKFQRTLSNKYPRLKNLFLNKITKSICMLNSLPINKRILDECCKEYGFTDLCTMRNIFKAYSFVSAIKTFIKLKIQSPLMRHSSK